MQISTYTSRGIDGRVVLETQTITHISVLYIYSDIAQTLFKPFYIAQWRQVVGLSMSDYAVMK